MQKYIQRLVIVFFCNFFLVNIALFAQDKRLDINISDEQKNFFKDLDKISLESTKKYGNFGKVDMANLLTKTQEEPAKEEAIFYFYSEIMPFATIKNIIPQFQKYKTLYPKTTFYIIFNGFPSNTFWKSLREIYKEEYKNLFKVKIHPRAYERFSLKQVPAWVFTACPSDFRLKQCDDQNAVLAKGNMSLNDFFELLSKHNEEKFGQRYKYLIEAK